MSTIILNGEFFLGVLGGVVLGIILVALWELKP